MGRRERRRRREGAAAPAALAATTAYTDPDGNVLTVRDELTPATIAELGRLRHAPGASLEDRWQREGEALFERLVVGWEVAGLPLAGQKELLARYRMADADTRRWVRETLREHAAGRGLGAGA
jgi:hypothetical protein